MKRRVSVVDRLQARLPEKTLLIDWLSACIPKRRSKAIIHGLIAGDDGLLRVAELLHEAEVELIFLIDTMPTRSDADSWLFGGASRVLKTRSAMGMYHYLTARWVFTTYGIHGDRRGRRGQTVINLWHGEQGGKLVGRYEGTRRINCDLTPATSSVGRALRAASFGVPPDRVPVIGAPRNDRLLSAPANRARRCLAGEAECEFVALWMPTFRNAWGWRSSSEPRRDGDDRTLLAPDVLAQLGEWAVGAGAAIAIKVHPSELGRVGAPSSAIRVLDNDQLHSCGLTTNQLLAGADVLVTDVSSVWQDYLLLDKPMVCAFPDIDSYRRNRGINLEPYSEWFPGQIVRSAQDLVDELQRVSSGVDSHAAERASSLRRLHRHRDSGAGRRLMRELGLG